MMDSNSQAFLLVFLGIVIIVASLLIIMRFIKKDQAANLVDKFLKEGNYKRALAISFKLANQKPNDYLPKYNIGLSYLGMKDYLQAIEYFERASIAAENSAGMSVKINILLKIAGLYKSIRKYNEALGYYVMVLDLDAYNIPALKDSSEILYDLKNYKKAKEFIDSLLRLKQDGLKLRYMLANIEFQLNHHQNAAVHLEVILSNPKYEKDELYSKSAMMLADIQFQMKNYSKSLQILRTMMDKNQYFDEVIEKMVNIYIKTKQINQAMELANRYLGKVSKEKQCALMYLIATTNFAGGEIYKAIKTWEKAYNLNPSYRDLKSLMGQYAYILQNPKIEPLFGRSEVDLEKMIMHILKRPYVKQMIKKDNYWAIESRDRAYVFYRKPYPIPMTELAEIESVVSQNFKVNSMFTLYSLYGVVRDTGTTKRRFGSQNMDMVAESLLIDAVNNS